MMKNRDNSYKARGAVVGALLILCLILLPIWWQTGIWYEDRLIVEQKAQDTVNLAVHANELTTNINSRFALLEGLYAFTLANPTEDKLDANFDTFASGLYVSAKGIRNFALAPDGVQRHVYPLEGNENVLGHDLINDERPNVRADVQRTIDTRQIVLSGPYELRQGGLGLVARKALFVNDTFWGLVTMVIDMEPVLDKANLEAHYSQFIYTGIRDDEGNVFYGDSLAFDSQPVTQRIELPDGYWEIAQAPIGGWGAPVRNEVLAFKGIGLVIVGLITALAYLLINRQSRLAYLVQMRTHELSEANDELKNDIIKRKKAEEEVLKYRNHLEEMVKERTAQLEATNKELEAFSFSVSHDLKAPLRSLNGFSNILLEDYHDKLDERGKDYLNRVRSGTQKMSLLIDAMLTLSRLTRGELNRVKVDMTELAKSTASCLQESEPDRKVEFVIAENMTANGDAAMVNAVIENLLGNAWKFTGKHPTARIEFGVTKKNGKTIYFVKDDGAGFDPAYSDNLFVPFQRLHTESEFPGIGIGLATVQRIINQHKGRIWAEGEVEKGATFYFTLE